MVLSLARGVGSALLTINTPKARAHTTSTRTTKKASLDLSLLDEDVEIHQILARARA